MLWRFKWRFEERKSCFVWKFLHEIVQKNLVSEIRVENIFPYMWFQIKHEHSETRGEKVPFSVVSGGGVNKLWATRERE